MKNNAKTLGAILLGAILGFGGVAMITRGFEDSKKTDDPPAVEDSVTSATFETFQDESLYTTRALEVGDTVAGKWIRVSDLDTYEANLTISVEYNYSESATTNVLFNAGTYVNTGGHAMAEPGYYPFSGDWQTNDYTDTNGVRHFEFYVPADGATLTFELSGYTGTLVIDKTTTFTAVTGTVLELIPN